MGQSFIVEGLIVHLFGIECDKFLKRWRHVQTQAGPLPLLWNCLLWSHGYESLGDPCFEITDFGRAKENGGYLKN